VVALALSKVPEPRPPLQTILNRLWEEANHPATRWKRTSAIIAGGALAVSIAAIAGWALLPPIPSAPPPLARPAPAPAAQQAPVPAPVTSSASPAEPRTAPTVGTAMPAVVPAAAARATPPAAPAAASPPRRAERQEQRRVPQAPAKPANERPAASSDAGDPDPSAIIDWILEQRAAGRRGQ
jgi:hypothetical protein